MCSISTTGGGSKYEEEEVENEMPIVVWKDSASKAEGAFVVPEKGNNEYAIRRGAQESLDTTE